MTEEKSIDYLIKKLGLILLTVMPISIFAGVDNGVSDSLRQALEDQGWQAERAEDGSLDLPPVTCSGNRGPGSTGHESPAPRGSGGYPGTAGLADGVEPRRQSYIKAAKPNRSGVSQN